MFRTSIAALAAIVTIAAIAPRAQAQDAVTPAGAGSVAGAAPEARIEGQDRLMIVNRNSGRVIYDDGRNDLFCSTRVYIAGYTDWGRPIYRRNMRCR